MSDTLVGVLLFLAILINILTVFISIDTYMVNRHTRLELEKLNGQS